MEYIIIGFLLTKGMIMGLMVLEKCAKEDHMPLGQKLLSMMITDFQIYSILMRSTQRLLMNMISARYGFQGIVWRIELFEQL